jgi:hypothetical protein
MENLDIIILTVIVVVLYLGFGLTIFKTSHKPPVK